MSREPNYDKLRAAMVQEQLIGHGISDLRVLDSMRDTPRHIFVEEKLRPKAYQDSPLPTGPQSTISQPYIVAKMLERLELLPGDRVLEIGTGTGYQAALLAQLVSEVFTIEYDDNLAKEAARNLKSLGFSNVTVRCGDGFSGWREQAPFDAIIVAAAPKEIPRELVAELKIGGRMILPLATSDSQELLILRKSEKGIESEELGGVRFVAMKGDSNN